MKQWYAFYAIGGHTLSATEDLRALDHTAFTLCILERRRRHHSVKARRTVGDPVAAIAGYLFAEMTREDLFRVRRDLPNVRPVLRGDGMIRPMRERHMQSLFNKRALWLMRDKEDNWLPMFHDTDADQARALAEITPEINPDQRARLVPGAVVSFMFAGQRQETPIIRVKHDHHNLFLILEAMGREIAVHEACVHEVAA